MRFRKSLVAAAFGVAAVVSSGCQSDGGWTAEEHARWHEQLEKKAAYAAAWPDVVCGTNLTARVMLENIAALAFVARQEGKLAAPLYTTILARIGKCKKNDAPTQLSEAQHCTMTSAAHDAAWAGNWELCKNELDHGH